MNFEQYAKDFEKKAKESGRDEAYIKTCLAYAQNLKKNNLPIIYSLDHLANLVGFKESYLRFASHKTDGYYRNFSIPKKSGGIRLINEPLPNLKSIQIWILENILYKLDTSTYAKAFIRKKSIKDNSRFHRGQPMVLTLDIENFFPSLSVVLINSFFRKMGYSKKVSYILTRLCSLSGGLPQGAPTSPALSNLLFKPLDNKIANYCIPRNIRYTRYADDMTFSGEFSCNKIIHFVRQTLSNLRLDLNEKKTRLMRAHQRQEVTGIVVNKKLQAPIDCRKELRQCIYYIEKYGIESHLEKIGEMRGNYVSHLLGKANFILFINPHDKDALKAKNILYSEKDKYDAKRI